MNTFNSVSELGGHRGKKARTGKVLLNPVATKKDIIPIGHQVLMISILPSHCLEAMLGYTVGAQ